MVFLFHTSSLTTMILGSERGREECFHDGCGNAEQSSLLLDYSADTTRILFVSLKIKAAVKAGRSSTRNAIFMTTSLGITSL